jgi:hypothetical protein
MRLRKIELAILSAFALVDATAVAQASDALNCPYYYPVIRSDFNDLGPYTCPLPSEHAQGALVSETYNALTGQNSASIDGLAAFVYRFPGYYSGDFRGGTAGVFVQGDGTAQFQPTATQSTTSETVTGGAFTQLAVANHLVGIGGALDVFRLRGGEMDASVGSRSATFVGEWIPIYMEGVGLPKTAQWGASGKFIYTVSPELMVQYDQFLNGTTKPSLFFAHNDALRVGPELVIQSFVEAPNNLPKEWKDFLNALSSTVTLHESWDSYTGKNYEWFMASLTYTFKTVEGYAFGVSASYGYGNSEATGALTNQVKLGFSFKL